MNNLNSINNNGVPYYFPADIAKEGDQYVRISNFFKTRVGDNGKVLPFKWYDQGRVMNVHGFIPFIQGLIGKFSTDDNDEVIMAPDASYREWQGSTANAHDGGFIDYILEDQMFPQEGIFKGHFGLKDGNGNVLTSVNIIFEVLGNDLRVGETVKYYLGDLENLKNQYKIQGEQAVADFNAKIKAGTETDRQTLDALRASIQANYDGQKNLSERVAGVQQQIDMQNIVTKQDFAGLSNQITQQITQMKENGLEFFKTADDLRNTYPKGANKLCVTLDDSHQWVYDYVNGRWNDAGAFNYGTIDPKLTTAIYNNNSDNLIPNSDFLTTDLWSLGRDDQSSPDCFIEPTRRGNALIVNGYTKAESTDRNRSWAKTPFFEVADSKYISAGAEIALSGIDYNNGKSALIDFTFQDKDGNVISYTTEYIPASFQDGQFHKITEMHIAYPANTVSVSVGFALDGLGTLKIRRPQASFSNALNSYSSSDLETKLALTDGNLLIGQPAKDWDFSQFHQKYTVDNDNIITFDCSNAGDTDYNFIASDYIAVSSNDQFIANVEAQINSMSSSAYLEIDQYADIDTQIPNSNIDQYFINTNELTDFVFDNIELQPSTKFIQIRIVTYSKAILKIGKISLKKKSTLDIACDRSLRSNNLAYDFSYKNWRPLLNFTKCVASENDGTVKITSTDPSNFEGLTSSNIAVDATKPLNISFNAKSDRLNDYSRWVEIDQIDSNNKINPDKNIKIEIANTSKLQKYNFNNLRLDSATKYIQIKLVIWHPGSIWINNLKCTNEFKTDEDSSNLFDDIPLIEWLPDNPYTTFDEQSNTWNISTRNQQSKWFIVRSNLIAVKPGSMIKMEGEVKVGVLPNNQGQSYVEIQQFADRWNQADNSKNIDNVFTEDTKNKFKAFEFISKLSADTKYIEVNMVVQNNADFQLRSIKCSCVDEIPNGLPKLNIDGTSNITDKWQSAPFKFKDNGRLVEGYVQYAMQGDSSRHYSKKNLKLKFFSDADYKQKLKWKPKSDWDKNNKFNIKANWIDATQSRNLANSELFKQAISVTPINDPNVANKLLQTQDLSQIEGFPIELSFADGYYGLMTFNTKKDAKLYGIDSNDPKQEAITNLVGNEYLDDPKMSIDGTHFGTVVNSKPSAELQANFTKFLTFINTASDDDFKKNINNYIDLYSVINLYLFGVWSYEYDYYNKSEILLTYNAGVSYYMLPYDLDSTWRLYWDGSWLLQNDVADFANANKNWIDGNGNKLISRIYQLFKPEIKAQWQKLRSSVWTNANAVNVFKKYINSIPELAYEKEQAKWPDIPSKKITNFGQIQQAIIERGNAMDKFMEGL